MIPTGAALPGPGGGTSTVLLGVGALLLVLTMVRGLALRRRGDDPAIRRRWRSLLTWWILFLLVGVAVVFGRGAVVLLMTVASLFLLRESLSLANARRALPFAAALAAALYLWAWLDWPTVFLQVLPVLMGLLLLGELMRRAPGGPRLDRPTAVGRAFLLSAVCPSFLVALASLPPPRGQPQARLGWLLFVVVLTELNDAAQAWSGKALGAQRMAPRISPKKTWEGFAGGVTTTTLLAVVLAPLLTEFGRGPVPGGPSLPPWLWSAGVGLLVALAGTAGDLLASAEKRRAGVKDSGDLLPGHGGLLDRFDSVALSGPVFFFLSYLIWFGGG